MDSDDQLKILIAELEPRLLMNFELIARDEDLWVITCKDGLEALKMAHKEIPALIIISTNVPGLNAFNICRLLKFDQQYKDIKIIILANSSSRESEERAEKAGADQLLVKPFTDSEILNYIQVAVGRCRWKGQKILWLDNK